MPELEEGALPQDKSATIELNLLTEILIDCVEQVIVMSYE